MSEATAVATVTGLAVEACEIHADAKAAAGWMRDQLDALPEVVAAEMDKIIWAAIRNAVYERRHDTRSAIKARCGRDVEAMNASALAARASILDTWATPDGKRLGDATGSDLEAYAAQERRTAQGHERNAVFYEALRALTPERAKVRNRVSADVANDILAEAGK